MGFLSNRLVDCFNNDDYLPNYNIRLANEIYSVGVVAILMGLNNQQTPSIYQFKNSKLHLDHYRLRGMLELMR